MEICPQGPIEELIQRLAIPPTIHISFARTESSVTQYPSVETLVVHLDVKGFVSVNGDSCSRQERSEEFFGFVR
jgi:hypothetical protein